PAARATFMENLTAYDSNVLSEVPNYDTYHDNNVFEQSVQEMQYSEQPVIDDDLNIEITSDNNVISYDQYLKENKNEVVQSTTSPEQHDAMIMSVIDDMSNQVAKCNTVNQENKTLNVSLIVELEQYKEQKALDNIVYKMGQTVQAMHMLTKPQAFSDNTHKTTLGYQYPLYLCKAQRIQPVMYSSGALVEKHAAISLIETEETLMLAEESRIKMKEKQNDIVKEKK
ncbi:hypothetical protein Tco_0852478, partial [Tanacetum coccineum]